MIGKLQSNYYYVFLGTCALFLVALVFSTISTEHYELLFILPKIWPCFAVIYMVHAGTIGLINFNTLPQYAVPACLVAIILLISQVEMQDKQVKKFGTKTESSLVIADVIETKVNNQNVFVFKTESIGDNNVDVVFSLSQKAFNIDDKIALTQYQSKSGQYSLKEVCFQSNCFKIQG